MLTNRPLLIYTSYEPVPTARGLASLAPACSTDSQLAGGFAPWTHFVGPVGPPNLSLSIHTSLTIHNRLINNYFWVSYVFSYRLLYSMVPDSLDVIYRGNS